MLWYRMHTPIAFGNSSYEQAVRQELSLKRHISVLAVGVIRKWRESVVMNFSVWDNLAGCFVWAQLHINRDEHINRPDHILFYSFSYLKIFSGSSLFLHYSFCDWISCENRYQVMPITQTEDIMMKSEIHVVESGDEPTPTCWNYG
jgi:hypothetical protein